MKIAMSGSTGFIGTQLTNYLTALGHEVTPLRRLHFLAKNVNKLISILAKSDVVINLAGATITKRWTPSYIREMYESRVEVTRKIVAALHSAGKKPSLFISISAVGYYATEGCHTESSNGMGVGILAELCKAWEKKAAQCPDQIRLVIPRLGVVLASHGGALQKMLLPVKTAKVATVISPGTQPFPWINLSDLCRAMEYIINTPSLTGVVNFVSPEQVSQQQFVATLAKYHKALATIKLPAWLFKLLYGKGASFLITGQCVTPSKLIQNGFVFTTPTVESYFSTTHLDVR